MLTHTGVGTGGGVIRGVVVSPQGKQHEVKVLNTSATEAHNMILQVRGSRGADPQPNTTPHGLCASPSSSGLSLPPGSLKKFELPCCTDTETHNKRNMWQQHRERHKGLRCWSLPTQSVDRGPWMDEHTSLAATGRQTCAPTAAVDSCCVYERVCDGAQSSRAQQCC